MSGETHPGPNKVASLTSFYWLFKKELNAHSPRPRPLFSYFVSVVAETHRATVLSRAAFNPLDFAKRRKRRIRSLLGRREILLTFPSKRKRPILGNRNSIRHFATCSQNRSRPPSIISSPIQRTTLSNSGDGGFSPLCERERENGDRRHAKERYARARLIIHGRRKSVPTHHYLLSNPTRPGGGGGSGPPLIFPVREVKGRGGGGEQGSRTHNATGSLRGSRVSFGIT